MKIAPESIEQAANVILRGGLVAMPTETVYGLAADATRDASVRRVYEVKGRPSTNPLIVHVCSIEMARSCVAADWPVRAQRLAESFWPGPLTLVLRRGEQISALATAGGETVAIRMPGHPVALALIEEAGVPLVAPSANRSGEVSPTTADHVRESFDAHEVVVLDGGACREGIESTVVSVVHEPASILRPGVIGRERIERVLGEAVQEASTTATGSEIAMSPGQMARHYAPMAPARLVESAHPPEIDPDAIVLAREGRWEGWRVIRMPREAAEYARRLYAALREADALYPSQILIEHPPGDDDPLWRAIGDRLRRACAADG